MYNEIYMRVYKSYKNNLNNLQHIFGDIKASWFITLHLINISYCNSYIIGNSHLEFFNLAWIWEK